MAGAGVTCLPVTVTAMVRPVAVPLATEDAAATSTDVGERTRTLARRGAGGVAAVPPRLVRCRSRRRR